MKVLLDECVDQRLRLLLPGHECQTAAYAGFAGLKNGALLAAAETAGFEVVVTTDQEIPYQQNLSFHRIAILILSTRTNRLTDLRLLIPDPLVALERITAGAVMFHRGVTGFIAIGPGKYAIHNCPEHPSPAVPAAQAIAPSSPFRISGSS